MERREIRTSVELRGYSDFPGLSQVAEIKKRVVFMKSGEVKETTHYLITSLGPGEAGPSRLLSLYRGHWAIENRLFHVKDDSFGEDRHVLGSHQAGAVMSLLRAAAITLLRGESPLWTNRTPLTGRAQAIATNPIRVLARL